MEEWLAEVTTLAIVSWLGSQTPPNRGNFVVLVRDNVCGDEPQVIPHSSNQEFPGNDEGPCGPFVCQFFIYSKAIAIVLNYKSFLNSWLANIFQ
jgi:hypothetical protein